MRGSKAALQGPIKAWSWTQVGLGLVHWGPDDRDLWGITDGAAPSSSSAGLRPKPWNCAETEGQWASQAAQGKYDEGDAQLSGPQTKRARVSKG